MGRYILQDVFGYAWPKFRAANQTLSALALAIGTTLLLRVACKKSYALIAFIPCVFLVAVTLSADVLNIRNFAAQGNWLNVSLSVAILLLVVAVLLDNVRVWLKLLKTREPVGLNNGPELREPVVELND